MSVEITPHESEKVDPLAVGQICYDAYRQFAQRKRMMTHEVGSYPYCNEICDVVGPALAKKYPGKTIRVMGTTLGPTSGHAFLEMEDKDEVWVVDPMWQQFINREGSRRVQIPEQPTVICVKRDELGAELERRVPEDMRKIWLEAKPVRIVHSSAD